MHILVVDDESLARQRLIRMIDEMPEHEVIGQAINGEDAVDKVERLDPDLVFMDIRMPGVDGIQAAKTVAAMNEPPALIFCTAYDEYALQAFDSQAVGYLVKPVQREQLAEALNKAQKTNKLQRLAVLEQAQEHVGEVVEAQAPLEEKRSVRTCISARSRKGLELIPLEDIFCFVAEQKYVTVKYGEREILIDDTLKDLEEEFKDAFVRIHRNTLVAIDEIQGLERLHDGHYEVRLKRSDFRPPISRRHVARIKALLRQL
ncbi:MAG: DNA-binding response regulator [Alteromonadaceae bacterium]|nr:MAG: DNA-binding response regulator [Alteromonadaceae bacterium]